MQLTDRLGPAFWPVGPRTVLWTIDLDHGRFGPIGLGVSLDTVRAALGRPDQAPWFRQPKCCLYHRLGLWLSVYDHGSVGDVQFMLDGAFPSTFDPLVRTGSRSSRLSRLGPDDFRDSYGPPTALHDGGEDGPTLEWDRGRHVVYLDLGQDGASIQGLGFMLPEAVQRGQTVDEPARPVAV